MSDLLSIFDGGSEAAISRAQAEQLLTEAAAKRAELESDRLLIEHIRSSYYLSPIQWKMRSRNATFKDLESQRVELTSVKQKQLQLESYILDLTIAEIKTEIEAENAKTQSTE